MKTFLVLLTLAAQPLLTLPVRAQTPQGLPPQQAGTLVWHNDPMYSTHNYKHPDKSAAAQRLNSAVGVAVNRLPSGSNQVTNYKMPATQRISTGGITVSYTPELGVANRNYKMPRPHVTTTDVKTDVPTRRSNTATSD